MNQSIFLNNVVDLVNEIATFLHNFLLFLTPDPSKQLTICVFAGLTRKLILAPSDVTRYVSTSWIGWDAGSSPAGHERAIKGFQKAQNAP